MALRGTLWLSGVYTSSSGPWASQGQLIKALRSLSEQPSNMPIYAYQGDVHPDLGSCSSREGPGALCHTCLGFFSTSLDNKSYNFF